MNHDGTACVDTRAHGAKAILVTRIGNMQGQVKPAFEVAPVYDIDPLGGTGVALLQLMPLRVFPQTDRVASDDR